LTPYVHIQHKLPKELHAMVDSRKYRTFSQGTSYQTHYFISQVLTNPSLKGVRLEVHMVSRKQNYQLSTSTLALLIKDDEDDAASLPTALFKLFVPNSALDLKVVKLQIAARTPGYDQLYPRHAPCENLSRISLIHDRQERSEWSQTDHQIRRPWDNVARRDCLQRKGRSIQECNSCHNAIKRRF